MTPIDAAAFRHAMGRFATGVTVLTVRGDDGRDYGMTVSAFSSLSLSPPLVLACIGDDATIAGAVAAANKFAVSILADHQEALGRRFAASDTDRFAGAPISRGGTGLALLDGALAHLECAIVARHRGGDHTIVVGEVLAASAAADSRPLIGSLRTAVSAKRKDWLETNAKLVEQKHSQNKLTDEQYQELETIISLGREGKWADAEQETLRLAEAQQP